MKKAEAIKHFRTAYMVAKALRIAPSAVYRWPARVPELSARRLAELTGGALVFDVRKYSK